VVKELPLLYDQSISMAKHFKKKIVKKPIRGGQMSVLPTPAEVYVYVNLLVSGSLISIKSITNSLVTSVATSIPGTLILNIDPTLRNLKDYTMFGYNGTTWVEIPRGNIDTGGSSVSLYGTLEKLPVRKGTAAAVKQASKEISVPTSTFGNILQFNNISDSIFNFTASVSSTNASNVYVQLVFLKKNESIAADATQWVPTSISGLSLWLDATQPGNNTMVPNNLFPIKSWTDKSGQKNHANSLSEPLAPVYTRGNMKPAVYFGGSAKLTGKTNITDQNYTIFTVTSPDSRATQTTNILSLGDTNPVSIQYTPSSTSEYTIITLPTWSANNTIKLSEATTRDSLKGVRGMTIDTSKNLLYLIDTTQGRVVSLNLNTNEMTVLAGSHFLNINNDTSYLRYDARFSWSNGSIVFCNLDPDSGLLYISENPTNFYRTVNTFTGEVSTLKDMSANKIQLGNNLRSSVIIKLYEKKYIVINHQWYHSGFLALRRYELNPNAPFMTIGPMSMVYNYFAGYSQYGSPLVAATMDGTYHTAIRSSDNISINMVSDVYGNMYFVDGNLIRMIAREDPTTIIGTYQGSISGTTLTLTAAAIIPVGSPITGTGILPGTIIVVPIGLEGIMMPLVENTTYTVNISQTVAQTTIRVGRTHVLITLAGDTSTAYIGKTGVVGQQYGPPGTSARLTNPTFIGLVLNPIGALSFISAGDRGNTSYGRVYSSTIPASFNSSNTSSIGGFTIPTSLNAFVEARCVLNTQTAWAIIVDAGNNCIFFGCTSIIYVFCGGGDATTTSVPSVGIAGYRDGPEATYITQDYLSTVKTNTVLFNSPSVLVPHKFSDSDITKLAAFPHYLTDTGNHSIRLRNGNLIDNTVESFRDIMTWTTIAGAPPPTATAGFADGDGLTVARFRNPYGIIFMLPSVFAVGVPQMTTFAQGGADQCLYVTDSGNNCIRKITPKRTGNTNPVGNMPSSPFVLARFLGGVSGTTLTVVSMLMGALRIGMTIDLPSGGSITAQTSGTTEFVGSISNTTLTVTAVNSGTIIPNMQINTTAGGIITAQATGSPAGGIGTYTIDKSQTVAAGTTIVGSGSIGTYTVSNSQDPTTAAIPPPMEIIGSVSNSILTLATGTLLSLNSGVYLKSNTSTFAAMTRVANITRKISDTVYELYNFLNATFPVGTVFIASLRRSAAMIQWPNILTEWGVSTVAGPMPTDGIAAGPSGNVDGRGTDARFNNPTGIISQGSSLYITDTGNNAIRRVDLSFTFHGIISGTTLTVENTASSITIRIGMYISGAGVAQNTKITGFGNARGTTGTYTVNNSQNLPSANFIGSISGTTMTVTSINSGKISIGMQFKQGGTGSITAQISGSDGGVGIYTVNTSQTINPGTNIITNTTFTTEVMVTTLHVAELNAPRSLYIDGANLLIADTGNHVIRQTNFEYLNSRIPIIARAGGNVGSSDGIGKLASFENPTALSIDKNGVIYVFDGATSNISKLRVITPSTFPPAITYSPTESLNQLTTTTWAVRTVDLYENSLLKTTALNAYTITSDSMGNIYFIDGISVKKIVKRSDTTLGTSYTLTTNTSKTITATTRLPINETESIYNPIITSTWSNTTNMCQLTNGTNTANSIIFTGSISVIDNTFMLGDSCRYFDGVVWNNTLTPSAIPVTVKCYAYNGSLWVVGGTNTFSLSYSNNGIFWTTSPTGNAIFTDCIKVLWGGNKFVAIGIPAENKSPVAYSTDGMTWQQAPTARLLINIGERIGWNGSKWLIIGPQGTSKCFIQSTDGIIWTLASNVGDITINSIHYTANKWFRGGNNSPNLIMTSLDGITWSPLNTPVGGNLMKDTNFKCSINTIASKGTMLIAGGYGAGANLIYSIDSGVTWNTYTNLRTSTNGGTFNSMGSSSMGTTIDHIYCDGTYWHLFGGYSLGYHRSLDGFSWYKMDFSTLIASPLVTQTAPTSLIVPRSIFPESNTSPPITILNVSAVTSGTISIGMSINTPKGGKVASFLTGTGNTGTYILDTTQRFSVPSTILGIRYTTIPTCDNAAKSTQITSYNLAPTNFKGYIHEILVYAQTLTSSQRESVEGYLASKWAIPLEKNHPYTLSGPTITDVSSPSAISSISIINVSCDSITLSWEGGTYATKYIYYVYKGNYTRNITLSVQPSVDRGLQSRSIRFDWPTLARGCPFKLRIVATNSTGFIESAEFPFSLPAPIGTMFTIAGNGIQKNNSDSMNTYPINNNNSAGYSTYLTSASFIANIIGTKLSVKSMNPSTNPFASGTIKAGMVLQIPEAPVIIPSMNTQNNIFAGVLSSYGGVSEYLLNTPNYATLAEPFTATMICDSPIVPGAVMNYYSNSRLSVPYSICSSLDGNTLYVYDSQNNRIVKITKIIRPYGTFWEILPWMGGGGGVNFQGYINNPTNSASGNTLTVTSITSGIIRVGMAIYGDGCETNPTITALGTGTTGGVGTYTVSISQRLGSSTSQITFTHIAREGVEGLTDGTANTLVIPTAINFPPTGSPTNTYTPITISAAGTALFSGFKPEDQVTQTYPGSCDLCRSLDGKRIYVLNRNNSTNGAAFRLINLETSTVSTFYTTTATGTAPAINQSVPFNQSQWNYPDRCALSPDGTTLYVSDFANKCLRAINPIDSTTYLPTANATVTTILDSTRFTGVKAFTVSKSGLIYAVNSSGILIRYSPNDKEVLQLQMPITLVRGIAVSRDENTLYFSDTANNKLLYMPNVKSFNNVVLMNLCGTGQEIIYGDNTSLMTTNNGYTNAIGDGHPSLVQIYWKDLNNIVISDDGKYLYVCCTESSLIRVVTLTQEDTLPMFSHLIPGVTFSQ